MHLEETACSVLLMAPLAANEASMLPCLNGPYRSLLSELELTGGGLGLHQRAFAALTRLLLAMDGSNICSPTLFSVTVLLCCTLLAHFQSSLSIFAFLPVVFPRL